MKSMSMSRRGFVAGAVTLGAASVPAVALAEEQASGEGIPEKSKMTAEFKPGYATYDANITPIDESFVIQPVKEDDVDADEVVECDYLVIGSGNCGLLSAARASELGLKVVLIEATEDLGGSSSGTEAHFGLDTIKYVKDAGKATWTIPEAADYFNLYNEYHSSQTLLMSFLNHLNEPFDWWIDKGAEVDQLLDGLAGIGTSAGLFFKGRAAALAEIDKQVIAANGVESRVSTRATHLVVNDGGDVVGALAETQGGTAFFKATYTFMGTGGFGNNPDMVNAYMGARGNAAIVGDSIQYHNGDGINMMLGVGGITGVLESASVGGIQVPGAAYEGDVTRAASEPFLWVNKFGQRIGCEYWTNPTYGYALIAWSPEYCSYTVFDQSLVERMETENFFCQSKYLPYTYDPVPTMGEELAAGVEEGTVFRADTLEELAEMAGIAEEAFVQTVADYNASCAAGEDAMFYKDASMLLPIETGPFYAIKQCCNRLSSLNGCMINADCQVIDGEGNWIQGLFAGGLDSAGFFIGDYNHAYSGSCSSFSFFTGWRSAEMAARLLGKTEG